jgi:hypothetical protein
MAAAVATLPLSLLIHLDYGSKFSPKLVSLNGNDTWLTQSGVIAREMGLALDLFQQYTVRFASFGHDVIEPGNNELRTVPLIALGIAATGWTAHCVAPAQIRPVRQKRTPAGSADGKEEKKSDADKFAGLTPSNIITKLRTAKVNPSFIYASYLYLT